MYGDQLSRGMPWDAASESLPKTFQHAQGPQRLMQPIPRYAPTINLQRYRSLGSPDEDDIDEWEGRGKNSVKRRSARSTSLSRSEENVNNLTEHASKKAKKDKQAPPPPASQIQIFSKALLSAPPGSTFARGVVQGFHCIYDKNLTMRISNDWESSYGGEESAVTFSGSWSQSLVRDHGLDRGSSVILALKEARVMSEDGSASVSLLYERGCEIWIGGDGAEWQTTSSLASLPWKHVRLFREGQAEFAARQKQDPLDASATGADTPPQEHVPAVATTAEQPVQEVVTEEGARTTIQQPFLEAEDIEAWALGYDGEEYALETKRFNYSTCKTIRNLEEDQVAVSVVGIVAADGEFRAKPGIDTNMTHMLRLRLQDPSHHNTLNVFLFAHEEKHLPTHAKAGDLILLRNAITQYQPSWGTKIYTNVEREAENRDMQWCLWRPTKALGAEKCFWDYPAEKCTTSGAEQTHMRKLVQWHTRSENKTTSVVACSVTSHFVQSSVRNTITLSQFGMENNRQVWVDLVVELISPLQVIDGTLKALVTDYTPHPYLDKLDDRLRSSHLLAVEFWANDFDEAARREIQETLSNPGDILFWPDMRLQTRKPCQLEGHVGNRNWTKTKRPEVISTSDPRASALLSRKQNVLAEVGAAAPPTTRVEDGANLQSTAVEQTACPNVPHAAQVDTLSEAVGDSFNQGVLVGPPSEDQLTKMVRDAVAKDPSLAQQLFQFLHRPEPGTSEHRQEAQRVCATSSDEATTPLQPALSSACGTEAKPLAFRPPLLVLTRQGSTGQAYEPLDFGADSKHGMYEGSCGRQCMKISQLDGTHTDRRAFVDMYCEVVNNVYYDPAYDVIDLHVTDFTVNENLHENNRYDGYPPARIVFDIAFMECPEFVAKVKHLRKGDRIRLNNIRVKWNSSAQVIEGQVGNRSRTFDCVMIKPTDPHYTAMTKASEELEKVYGTGIGEDHKPSRPSTEQGPVIDIAQIVRCKEEGKSVDAFIDNFEDCEDAQFRLRGRVIATSPSDIENFLQRQCTRCETQLDKGETACQRCKETRRSKVRQIWNFALRMELEPEGCDIGEAPMDEDRSIWVNVMDDPDNTMFMNGLLPEEASLEEAVSLLRQLVATPSKSNGTNPVFDFCISKLTEHKLYVMVQTALVRANKAMPWE